MTGGWYKLTGTLTGSASAKNFGVRVKAGKTVYVDSFSLQAGVGSSTTFSVGNSGTGNLHHNWEGTGTMNAGVASEPALINKGATSQSTNIKEDQNSVGTVLGGVSSTGVRTAPNFVSTVAVGTQPYATTSTTKNTNLNSDQVDGADLDTDGTLALNSDVKIPSQKAVKTYADTKQTALGYTAENTANKDTDGTLSANSDTKYASQKATKTYADTKAPIASPTFTGTATAPTIVSTTVMRLKGYTVATLPAGVQGDVAFCTDLLLPAFLAVAVGGGAVVGVVFFDGVNWITI